MLFEPPHEELSDEEVVAVLRRRNRYQGFVVAGHDDRLAVLVSTEIAADIHRSKVRHAVEFNVNGASSTA